MEQEAGDIVVLVGPRWRINNYPLRRIWHDELYAELVFAKNGRIERIGEPLNRYENLPEWSVEYNRVEKCEGIFQGDCMGEIVGLFKFTSNGRDIFLDRYEKILNSDEPNIHVVEWGEQTASKTKFNFYHP